MDKEKDIEKIIKKAIKKFVLEIEEIIEQKTENLYPNFDSGKWDTITSLIHNHYKELYGE